MFEGFYGLPVRALGNAIARGWIVVGSSGFGDAGTRALSTRPFGDPRDETLQRQYDANFAQKEQALRAQDLEAAKKGEQFQIQDRARPPVKPASPNVPQIVLLGLLGGLGLGVGLASLLEFSNHSIRNEEEFADRYPDLPILGSIPNLDADTRPSGGLLGRYGRSKSAAGVFLFAVAVGLALLVAGGFFA